MFLLRSRVLHYSFLFLCAALLFFGLSSHSSGPAFATAGQSGTKERGIYLYRRGALAAYAQPFSVLVDGKAVGVLANASYLRLPLEPGVHEIQVAPGGLAQVTTLQVHADADGRAFYEFVFPTGWEMRPSFQGATIASRNEEHALGELQGLRSLTTTLRSKNAPNWNIPDN